MLSQSGLSKSLQNCRSLGQKWNPQKANCIAYIAYLTVLVKIKGVGNGWRGEKILWFSSFFKVSFSPNIIQNFICKGMYLFQYRQCLEKMHKTPNCITYFWLGKQLQSSLLSENRDRQASVMGKWMHSVTGQNKNVPKSKIKSDLIFKVFILKLSIRAKGIMEHF